MQAVALNNILATSEGLHPALLAHLISPMQQISDAGAGPQLPQLIKQVATSLARSQGD
ncbi:hypothetical protein [Hoyosella altamirensis]|uniref:Uncharacterized protein n=1 Tax=Hoyosella altamirensis TaxID=616997 RepID=A0A839RMX8_9ACTN|nr:hypothetical protein [Hoyosella altamirensis]MBB3038312.1 hypothetical protein [Hoyosella altamirensis]